MIRAIFFDLDNTLYDQNLYFSSAYGEIAEHLEKCFSLPCASTFSMLMELLREKGSMYSRLFDDLLECIGHREEKMVRVLVELFHHAPVDTLIPYEDAGIVLPRLARSFPLGIITNGHAAMQRRKVTALGLGELLPLQVFTADRGHPKPDKRCYEYALVLANVRPQESLYIGDNPHVDFIGAKCIGMGTIRRLRGEFAMIQSDGGAIDAQVGDFYELEGLIANLTSDGAGRK